VNPEVYDNRTRLVKDSLVSTIRQGDVVSVAAATFSMYAYQELAEQLESVGAFRFLFTSPSFVAEKPTRAQREFYIPRMNRERGVCGTPLELRLRNELTQKAVAGECAAWIRRKATFKSADGDGAFGTSFLGVERPDDCGVYVPFDGFTTKELGTCPGEASLGCVFRQDASGSRMLLNMFEQSWNSPALRDVTDQVVDAVECAYRENPPELVYYYTLYRIFHEFLDGLSPSTLPNEETGLKRSKIWSKLYDFQKDAAYAIINKLETYRGCILADSVGLGKTFTALAVIKYYQSLGMNVLVLCPKKLADNWVVYRSNAINNPISEDRLRYDVLFHTDLSRDRGQSVTMGLDLSLVDWGNYGLVVIDESHNFRNGADSARGEGDKLNRYERLVSKVIEDGCITKVLMLSATPVNNRFRDLRNQLRLAYSDDPQGWSQKLGLSCDVETVFRRAQGTYTEWSHLPVEQRTTGELAGMLDADFFQVLDQVTVARSRRHIQTYYDMAAIGAFPQRRPPVSKRPPLAAGIEAVNYREIYALLDRLSLAVYLPSSYILPSRMEKYAQAKGGVHGNLTSSGREQGVRRLMCANLLKRLESSVFSFKKTLGKVRLAMASRVQDIADYHDRRTARKVKADCPDWDFDLDIDDENSPLLEVEDSNGYDLADLDTLRWDRDMRADMALIDELLAAVEPIDPAHDGKLQELLADVEHKVANPFNEGNRKVIVFTAFADTATYLYEQLSASLGERLGLHVALVTGGQSGVRCTHPRVQRDMAQVLACFSPVSKERDATYPRLAGCDVDVLVATDCISEGQNLQDCDYLVNFDIHWNPVRIVQRFGRIDRIGSRNAQIQLVNYWPDVELDEYINLKARVEQRMRITVMTSTGDDDLINAEEDGDLEYRRQQLARMQSEVIDLEDVSGGVSITDLGFNDFRMDLLAYHGEHPELERVPGGINAVVRGEKPGVVFVLRNVNQAVNPEGANRIHPFYLVYMGDDGTLVHGHLEPKATLDVMRALCRGASEPNAELVRSYARATKDGRDMRRESALLRDAVATVVDRKQQSDVQSFFSGGTTGFLENDVAGLDDFELVCFLVVRP
jgi:hypothetical protein